MFENMPSYLAVNKTQNMTFVLIVSFVSFPKADQLGTVKLC